MIGKIVLGLSVLAISTLSAIAQFDSLDNKITKSEIELFKNDQNLIPLQKIYELNIASISFSKSKHKIFQNRIDDYQVSTHFFEDTVDSIDFEKQHIFILQADTINIEVDQFLDSIRHSDTKVILITSDSLVRNEVMMSKKYDVVLSVTKMDSANLDKAIQIIFGGQIVDSPKSKIRLGYCSPTKVGIDSDSLHNGISEIIQEALDSTAFPGCQILIAKDGNVFYHQSFGYHTYAKERSVTNTDIYDLASITKATAATLALMKLYDNKQIDLDAKFADYWADFNRSNKKNITLREVLAHHARLKPWIPYYSVSQRKNGKYKRKTVSSDSSKRFQYRLSTSYFMHNDFIEKKIYKMIRKSQLNEEAGYRYSGLSFYLFPEIISNISGKEYGSFLDQTFYQPLSANTLGFTPTSKFSKDKIIPTEEDDYFRKELLHGVVHDEGAALMKGVSGNAGLFSNANDLAKVWQMLLNDGTYGGEQYLSKATINEFTKCQYCDEDNKRGLGFDKPLIEYDSIKSSVAKNVSPNSYGHSGYTGTLVWADPDNDLLFIFLSNRVHPTRNNRKIYTLNIRPRIHNLVYGLLEN